jgi:hypothetical protein
MEAYNVFYGIALHQPGRHIPTAFFDFTGQSSRTTDAASIFECCPENLLVRVPATRISTVTLTDRRHKDEASKQSRLAVPEQF